MGGMPGWWRVAKDLESWMWAEAVSALERADRLHRQSFRPLPGRATQPAWEPPLDLLETPDALWIIVALPGVETGDVEVAIVGGTIHIAGTRPIPPALRGAAIHRLEIPYGRFERQVTLPAGRYELAHRALTDGCLTLSLHKLR
jgi:HSP20 family protein